jgi:hypothetical protein
VNIVGLAEGVGDKLAQVIPEWEFRVTGEYVKEPVERGVLIVTLMVGPEEAVVQKAFSGRALTLNPYSFLVDSGVGLKYRQSNGVRLNKGAWEAMRLAVRIANRGNYDEESGEGYFLLVGIGRQGEPYRVRLTEGLTQTG